LASGKPALHRTTLDGALQDTIERLARLARAGLDPNATLAILVVDNRSRDILAWVGSSDFFDDDRSGRIDMVRAIRSPGSTLKPFIYGMALDDLLIHPETIVADAPTRFGDYRPENFLRVYMGEVTVREALQHSLNVPAVAVLEGVGPRRVDARLRAVGVDLRYGGSGGGPGLPLALGGVGVSLYDLVTLYAGLAEGGLVRPLRVQRGDDDDGDAPGVPVFGATAAWYIARILEAAPPPDGFVEPALSRANRRIAFKTGTSYGYRDAWALGYDGAHTVGVWVGRPDGAPSPDRFGRVTAAPVLYRIFGLLPDGGKAMPRRPAGVIEASNTELPPALRRFGTGLDVPDGIARALRPKLAIAFPPDGATIDLARDGEGYLPLPMVAEGGERPLRWLVNGRIVESPPRRRRADWRPDGEGFVAITVIDAQGRTASAEVLLR
jgi:penicillin-binding protein 1C